MRLKSRRTLAVVGGSVIAFLVYRYLTLFGFVIAALAKSQRKGCPMPDSPNTGFWDLSFLGFALLAGLSSILLLWDKWPSTKTRYILYVCLLIVLLPISTANIWGGDCFIAPPVQAIIDLILVVLGAIAIGLLWGISPDSVDGKVIKGVTVFLLALFVVIVPAVYGVLYLLYKFHWIEADNNVANIPDWIKALTSIPAAVIAGIDYLKGRNPESSKSDVTNVRRHKKHLC